MSRDHAGEPPTIDVTLDGRLVDPPSHWTRLSSLWHALPRGAVPALLATLVVGSVIAVLVLGFLLLVVPVVLVLGLVALLLRPRRVRTGGGWPATRPRP